jgi:hypothetical protein
MRKSYFLPVYESNALRDAEKLLPVWLAGPGQGGPALRVCTYLRQAAIASLLQTGESQTFRLRLQRSGRLYTAFLQASDADAQRRSQALPFFDALTAGDLDTAREIAQLCTTGWVCDAEAEDDFLFVHAFMRLAEDAAQDELERLASRWQASLEGSYDARLGVFQALLNGDAKGLQVELRDFLDARREELDDETRSSPEALATEVVISVEALGVLRLAQSRGIDLRESLRGAPVVARDAHPLSWTADSYWTLE